MKKLCKFAILMSVLVIVIAGVPSGKAFADGDETLGQPSIPIASGTGIVAAGVGLNSPPGTININVPGTVQQALLYWSCESVGNTGGDPTIVVDGTPVTGSLIGGATQLESLNYWTQSFRAVITSMVGTGDNSLSISGLDCGLNNHGAGLVVIYDDGSGVSDIKIRDGNDFAFCGFSGALNGTTPQTFTFAADVTDRIANLIMFFGTVGEDRPNSIEITVNGTTQTLSDQLNSNDGSQWDTFIQTVNIPAGATSITVEVFSRDDTRPGVCDSNDPPLPASLVWNAAGISVPIEAQGCTPGYWKQAHHFDSWTTYTPSQTFSAVFGRTITIRWSERGKPKPLSNPTLLQALEAKGGGINALARHSVAALLNTANSRVSYSYTESEVIEMFQTAFDSGDFETTKDMFAEANEAGCPLNNAETEGNSKANKKEKKKTKVIAILDPEDADGITGKVIIKDNGKVTKVKGVAKNMDPGATYQTLIYTGTDCVGDPVLIGNWNVKRAGKGKLKEIFRPGLELDDSMSVSVREVTPGAPLLKACGDF